MDIRQSFPYKNCESCPECILDVESTVVYAENGIITRFITVSCKNETLCRRLENSRRESKTDER